MTVRLERRFRSAEEAERIWRCVEADNPEFVSGRTTGARLAIEVDRATPASVRATLDDLIACLAVAERATDDGTPATERSPVGTATGMPRRQAWGRSERS